MGDAAEAVEAGVAERAEELDGVVETAAVHQGFVQLDVRRRGVHGDGVGGGDRGEGLEELGEGPTLSNAVQVRRLEVVLVAREPRGAAALLLLLRSAQLGRASVKLILNGDGAGVGDRGGDDLGAGTGGGGRGARTTVGRGRGRAGHRDDGRGAGARATRLTASRRSVRRALVTRRRAEGEAPPLVRTATQSRSARPG